jgi:hypothetical protein
MLKAAVVATSPGGWRTSDVAGSKVKLGGRRLR